MASETERDAKNRFRDRLRARMAAAGYAIPADAARAIPEVSQGTVYGWFRGTSPSLHMWPLICSLANTSSDYLLGLTDDPSPRPAPGPDPAEVEAARYARAVEALSRTEFRVVPRGSWPSWLVQVS